MKKHNPISLIVVLIILTANPLAQARESVYFQSMVALTANSQKLKNVDAVKKKFDGGKKVVIFNLDDVDDIERSISKGLPTNENEAKQVLLRRIDSVGQKNFNSTLIDAYGGVFYALKHKIDRYPAIVFDNVIVIYGEVDFLLALHRYNQWRQNQQVKSHD
jgi:integrating conjugative element protein (TIGR03757 family)